MPISSINGNPIAIGDGGIYDTLRLVTEQTENLLRFNFALLPSTAQNVTFELDDDQRVHVHGTPTVTGIRNIFEDIELEAGSYTYGTVSPVSGVALQARKVVNGQDAGYVDGLSGGASKIGYFTLSDKTTVRIRALYSGMDEIDGYLQPVLLSGKGDPQLYIPPLQMMSHRPNMELDYMGLLVAGSDLSEFTGAGVYVLSHGTYVNSPDDGMAVQGPMVVARRGNILYQVLINTNYETGEHINLHFRSGNNITGAWAFGPWQKAGPRHDISFHGTFADGGDFNDKTTGGVWTIATAQQFENGPSFKVQSGGTLVVFGRYDENAQQTYQVVFAHFDNAVYMRRRTGQPGSYVWSGWEAVGLGQRVETLNIISYPKPSYDATPAVTGSKLKVMTYNVAHWNNDTATYISDERLARLKQAIMSEDCDVIAIQELGQYIDGAEKHVNPYVFYPNYPYTYVLHETALASKTPLDSNEFITTSTGRWYSRSELTVHGKALAIYNVHPYPGTDSSRVELRRRDWQQIADAINADTSDFVVCLGDFNLASPLTVDDDVDEFERIFDSWTMANGGYLGWFETTGRYSPNMPADNILVSGGISISSVHALSEWYGLLYSDHVPVTATLVLRDEQ